MSMEIPPGNSMTEWTEALRSIMIHNPELYAKVMNQHLVVEPMQYRKDWLEAKYPRVKPEPEIV